MIFLSSSLTHCRCIVFELGHSAAVAAAFNHARIVLASTRTFLRHGGHGGIAGLHHSPRTGSCTAFCTASWFSSRGVEDPKSWCPVPQSVHNWQLLLSPARLRSGQKGEICG